MESDRDAAIAQGFAELDDRLDDARLAICSHDRDEAAVVDPLDRFGHVDSTLMIDRKDHERHAMVGGELRCGGCDTGVLDR